jgi:hypothetical protein
VNDSKLAKNFHDGDTPTTDVFLRRTAANSRVRICILTRRSSLPSGATGPSSIHGFASFFSLDPQSAGRSIDRFTFLWRNNAIFERF